MLAKIFRKIGLFGEPDHEFEQWRERGYAAPSPPAVKQLVLARHSPEQATWIETGTYLGSTTAFLSTRAKQVISIEPEPTLFANAEARFRGTSNVKILNGTSEALLPGVISGLRGNVAFWLDGHYSAGVTYKGTEYTPILAELASIGSMLPRHEKIAILIDDIRCFEMPDEGTSHYPERHVLVDWATEHGLSWHIEHDIFVAKNFR